MNGLGEEHEQSSGDEGASDESSTDAELERISAEEERVLARVHKHLAARVMRTANVGMDYDAELLALRDQINEARLEDIPPLIEEMERLSEVSARRAMVTEGVVDPRSPYFGRMVLEEGERKREVLIGRSTYLHSQTGIRIVDWRDAPVSRLYYRYEEGDEYDEEFGGREVHGEILTRRNLAITSGELKRIGAPQGTFIRRADGSWLRAGESARKLAGGMGAAMRAEAHHSPGKLGIGRDGDGREERYLPEITALIDPVQFDLITARDSGLVVIQGGAGSGKTTIGLHRLAYLSFQDKRRFRPDRMLVMVFNQALKRYISKVLPALGVEGVPVTTYERWAEKLRSAHIRGLPRNYDEDTPTVVTRLKKHPYMLAAIDRYVHQLERRVEKQLVGALSGLEGGQGALSVWRKHQNAPLAQRLDAVLRWSRPKRDDDERDRNRRNNQRRANRRSDAQRSDAQRSDSQRSDSQRSDSQRSDAQRSDNQADEKRPADTHSLALRHAIEREVERGKQIAHDVPAAWNELLTDLPALTKAFEGSGLSAAEIDSAHRWCTHKCPVVVAALEETRAEERENQQQGKSKRRRDDRDEEREGFDARARKDDRTMGIDGEEEDEAPTLDREDDTILLRLVQRLWGPLVRGRERISYEHILIDEAQDLSPVELAVVVETASKAQSITLAGDVAQRLMMDNGFTGWTDVLGRLGLDHVAVEPLRITYRSTKQIIDFARDVLGPLAHEEENTATREGAPVELFEFGHGGEAVAFLGEALRELMGSEPRCSVAVIARYPEHADMYYRGLVNAEVPYLRRIARQDFPFKPGIDVTDVRQVKGLEFDYVVLLEVSHASYPEDDEARHLLHIAATRAAHQLWVTSTGEPSSLLPKKLLDRME